jgi:multicomponent Na+:H+ antiporter subunit C
VNLFVAPVVAVLFGTGASLLLKPDLFRVVAGLMLISNAASLTVIASGLRCGQTPIHPLVPASPSATRSPQAMTLTGCWRWSGPPSAAMSTM